MGAVKTTRQQGSSGAGLEGVNRISPCMTKLPHGVGMWESFNMAIRQFPFDGDIQTGGRVDKGALTEREVRGSIPRED